MQVDNMNQYRVNKPHSQWITHSAIYLGTLLASVPKSSHAEESHHAITVQLSTTAFSTEIPARIVPEAAETVVPHIMNIHTEVNEDATIWKDISMFIDSPNPTINLLSTVSMDPVEWDPTIEHHAEIEWGHAVGDEGTDSPESTTPPEDTANTSTSYWIALTAFASVATGVTLYEVNNPATQPKATSPSGNTNTESTTIVGTTDSSNDANISISIDALSTQTELDTKDDKASDHVQHSGLNVLVGKIDDFGIKNVPYYYFKGENMEELSEILNKTIWEPGDEAPTQLLFLGGVNKTANLFHLSLKDEGGTKSLDLTQVVSITKGNYNNHTIETGRVNLTLPEDNDITAEDINSDQVYLSEQLFSNDNGNYLFFSITNVSDLESDEVYIWLIPVSPHSSSPEPGYHYAIKYGTGSLDVIDDERLLDPTQHPIILLESTDPAMPVEFAQCDVSKTETPLSCSATESVEINCDKFSGQDVLTTECEEIKEIEITCSPAADQKDLPINCSYNEKNEEIECTQIHNSLECPQWLIMLPDDKAPFFFLTMTTKYADFFGQYNTSIQLPIKNGYDALLFIYTETPYSQGLAEGELKTISTLSSINTSKQLSMEITILPESLSVVHSPDDVDPNGNTVVAFAWGQCPESPYQSPGIVKISIDSEALNCQLIMSPSTPPIAPYGHTEHSAYDYNYDPIEKTSTLSWLSTTDDEQKLTYNEIDLSL